MKKSDAVDYISENLGMNRSNVQKVIEKFYEFVQVTVSSGDSVHLRGFGRFFPKQRKGKKARNISKNQSIDIPPTTIPFFKPSQKFLNIVKKIDLEPFN